MAVIRAQRVVSESAGRDVDRHAIVWRELAAVTNHFHHIAAEFGVPCPAEVRRRTRQIDRRQRRISPRQRKRSHAQPLGAEIILDWPLGKSTLIDRIDDLQPLPMIDIYHRMAETVGDSSPVGSQRRIDINITALVNRVIGISVGLARNGVIDRIANPCGSIGVS